MTWLVYFILNIQVGDTAVEQVEKGSLDEMRPIMLELARTHIGNGVVDAHFDVRYCPEPRILSNHSHI